MLEIDHDFISFIVRNQNLQEVLNAGVKESDFLDDGRKYFRLLAGHLADYASCPDRKVFRSLSGTSVTKLGAGAQPLKFYLDRIVQRRCQLLVVDHDEKVKSAVQRGDWKGAVDAIYQTAAQITAKTGKAGEEGTCTVQELSSERRKRYKQALNSEDGITGFRFPWHSLNLMSGGFRLSDYVLFAGETGIGKSWLLCAIINHLVDQGLRVLVIPKEMPLVDFSLRLACVRGKFDHSKVIMGKLDDEERKRYFRFEKRGWKDTDIHFAKPGAVNNYRELRKLVQKIKPQVFAIDGTYLLAENTKAQLHERVSESSTQCRNIALDENVLGIGTCQLVLDKKAEQTGYTIGDLAHAKGQARDATHLFFIVRNNQLEITKKAWLVNLKTRQGGKKHVEIGWDIDGVDFEERRTIVLEPGRSGRKTDWSKEATNEEVKF